MWFNEDGSLSVFLDQEGNLIKRQNESWHIINLSEDVLMPPRSMAIIRQDIILIDNIGEIWWLRENGTPRLLSTKDIPLMRQACAQTHHPTCIWFISENNHRYCLSPHNQKWCAEYIRETSGSDWEQLYVIDGYIFAKKHQDVYRLLLLCQILAKAEWSVMLTTSLSGSGLFGRYPSVHIKKHLLCYAKMVHIIYRVATNTIV